MSLPVLSLFVLAIVPAHVAATIPRVRVADRNRLCGWTNGSDRHVLIVSSGGAVDAPPAVTDVGLGMWKGTGDAVSLTGMHRSMRAPPCGCAPSLMTGVGFEGSANMGNFLVIRNRYAVLNRG